MNLPRKVVRDRLQADLATVEDMIGRLTAEDVVMRLGMEDRRAELQGELAAFGDAPPDRAASATLFFGGAPVVGGVGIQSETFAKRVDFRSKVICIFCKSGVREIVRSPPTASIW